MWDAKSRQVIDQFDIPGGDFTDADISNDGRLVAVSVDTSQAEDRVEIWDSIKRELLHRAPHDFDYIEQIRFSRDGARLLAVGSPPQVVVWDTTTGKEVYRSDAGFGPGEQFKSASFSPDGSRLAVGFVGKVHLLDAESGRLLQELVLPHRHNVPELIFSENGKRLAVLQGGGVATLYNAVTWKIVQSLVVESGDGTLRGGVFVGDDCLATGSDDGRFRLWRLISGKILASAVIAEGACSNVAASADGKFLVTGGGWRWDNATREFQRTGDYDLSLWRAPAIGDVGDDSRNGIPKTDERM
ncbi:MAG: hypothetical protein RIC55_03415 [Pirellulaceae bacterium]